VTQLSGFSPHTYYYRCKPDREVKAAKKKKRALSGTDKAANQAQTKKAERTVSE